MEQTKRTLLHARALLALTRWLEEEDDGEVAGYIRAAGTLINTAMSLPIRRNPEETTNDGP